jgi:hypothetical protein
MTVWQLCWMLILHILRGRGGDMMHVYVRNLPSELSDAMQLRTNWIVSDMSCPGRPDKFVCLDVTPQTCTQPMVKVQEHGDV